MHKYAALMNDIEQRIQTGAIRPGQQLPSIRELSESYRCSTGTVVRAYHELERRHLVYAIPQSGYYAVQRKIDPGSRSAGTLMDFASAAPDPDVFPYIDFQHCINKAIDNYKNDLFVYGIPQGLPSLLKALSKHLANYQVFASADRIFIASGVQQALSILTLMPFPNGKRTVLLEQPGYPLFNRLLEVLGVPAIGLKRTAEGIDLDELERLFRDGDIKFFYTMPRFHQPLGTSYPEATKRAIAELAERYDVYVLEDDYMADLENDSRADPIYAYGSSRIVYLKSFSKIMFPGLRVGAAVLPEPLQDTFAQHKKLLDIDSSMLSQAALEIYIQSGMFARRRHQIRDTYSRRLARLNRALDAANDLPDVRHIRVSSGVHTHLSLPDGLRLPTLVDRLRKKQIQLEAPASYFLTDFKAMPLLKLGVSRVEEAQIDAGVSAIFAEIRRMTKRS
ncbi:aminotransferase-like domain-containing protein [Cohnella nanjingensis]|uniref:PLP-dependent aminotransferase family protein n=1 Tax=Cohnella nanjingensis TaxID=1387779 RepID=A0A7X0VGF7_9BACL|nr:PLP-dependent aminotransferase family protein [Cohnella nanjingensis]MBB6671604.1 PLP-dependent aminotransferase family protein [Cohnella nanjingensis]